MGQRGLAVLWGWAARAPGRVQRGVHRAAWRVGVSVVAVLLGGLSAPAGASEFRCPEQIVTQQTLAAPQAGWAEFVRPEAGPGPAGASRFAGIALYDGHPSDFAQLKPDREEAREPTWTLHAPAPADRPLYMACAYFGTRLQFIKALPLQVRTCTAKRGGRLVCRDFKR